MSDERTEDLNPRSDDVEERVKQMLDPSIPDVPIDSVAEISTDEKPEKIIVIKSSPSASKDVKISSPGSAPELPVNQTKLEPTPLTDTPLPPSVKNSGKKVIIPIEHHNEEPSATDPLLDGAPTSQLAREKVVKPINKITIADHDESPAQVAEKLDEAIAELVPSNQTPVNETASAPELDDAGNADTTEQLDELSQEIDTATALPELNDEETSELPIEDPEVLTDPKTDKAVADIVASESDEILEIEDAVRDSDEPVKKPKKQHRGLGKSMAGLLRKPAMRWALVLLVLGGGSAAAVVPTSRYFVLNTAGVRVSSTLTVLDDSTNQPLKNAEVRLGDSVATTDENGTVTLNKVRLGSSALTITKRAFAPHTKTVVMGWGSNPLGTISLSPTGTQYMVTVSDFLSGKTLSNVSASSGQADAVSDEKGVIKLTIDKPADTEFTVDLLLDGYRKESIAINPDNTSGYSAKLVPAKKQVYVSKRSGKYDVYSAYIDGKEEKVVLAGSGNERDDMVLVTHATANVAAYVSTRPAQQNSQGLLLSNLIIINLEDNDTTNVGSSEQIKLVSWSGDRLVYVQIAAGASAETPDRYRLVSYNYKDGSSKELAKSNFFNDVIGIGNTVYYAPSSAYQTSATKFFRINSDGTNNEELYDKEVWNILRTSYDHLALSVQQQWFDYRLGDKLPIKLNTAPADQVSRVYADSSDAKRSAWIDSRDGKGVLLTYDTVTKTDKTLKTENGITYPVRWLNDTVLVYRVKNNQETADYAISTDGGEAVKISDVTNSAGLARWL